MFLLSSGVVVDKMCVSHANEIGIYILHFILFQKDWQYSFIIQQKSILPPDKLK